MPTQQVVPAQCPNCGAKFNAPVENIINGQNPAMKAAFLQGRLNIVQCPQCGASISPAIPILYYDLQKELAFVLMPPQLNLVGPAQEKMIGNLTNQLINSLPTEQRKFYLFNPKQFLSIESMAKAILEADGITEEMLEAQTQKAKLIEEFLKTPDDEALKKLVETNDDKLDVEFFEILTAYMQAAQMSGDQARFQAFFALRTVLAEMSSKGREIVAQIDKELGLVVIKSQEELLERLENAENQDERESLVAAGQPLLDYTFFQKLTNKIDAATKKGNTQVAQKLKALRSEILDLKAKYEQEAQAALEKASGLLKKVLQSNAPDKVLADNLEEIDDAFFYLLRANIEEARRQKQEQPAQALEMIGNMAMVMLHEKYAPQEEQSEQPRQPQPQILTSK